MPTLQRGDLPDNYTEHFYAQIRGDRSFSFMDMRGAAIEDEYITVNGRIYEFSADGLPLTLGDVRIDVSGGLGAANAAAAFVSAINNDTYAPVGAYLLPDNIVGLYCDSDGTLALTLTENTTNMVVSAATFVGGKSEAERVALYSSYTITAVDVTSLGTVAGTAGISVAYGLFATGAPMLVGLVIRNATNQLRYSALTDANIAVAWVQVTGLLYALRVIDAGGILATGDTINQISVG